MADTSLSNASKVQLGLTIALCVGVGSLAWSASNIKADALKEIREQYVNKDLFNAKFDMISLQLATQNDRLSELRVEVKALRDEGNRK